MGFFDDGVAPGTSVSGVAVVGGMNELSKQNGLSIVVAIGDPAVKAEIVEGLKDFELTFPTLIHPKAVLQDEDRIGVGEGSIICAGSVLTTDIRVGRHVLLNLNVTVGHDVTIGDCSSIMPGTNLAGLVKIGFGVLVGSGANVINKVVVGDNSKVGAGAVVIRDVPAGATVVGVPARNV